jgi:hypothetical protein
VDKKIKKILRQHITAILVCICSSILAVIFLSPLFAHKKSDTSSNNSQRSSGLTIFNDLKPEDLYIKPATTKEYAYQNTSNNFLTHFKSDPAVEGAIKFSNSKSNISFYTQAVQSFGTAKSATPTTKDNTINYPNVFPNIDIKYTLSPTRLLEEFVVTDPNSARSIDKILQTATTQSIDSYQEKNGTIEFYRQSVLVAVIPQPVMYEQRNPDNKSYGISYEVIPQQNQTYQINKVITNEGKAWLADSNRQYPIIIDLVIDNADTVNTGSSTEIDYMEYSSDALAQAAYIQPLATGGTISTLTGYRLHTFTSSGTFTTPATGIPYVETLVVGGGGGGGTDVGGGGGAGGVVYNSAFAVAVSTAFPITVGNGGGSYTSGGNSSFSTITAYGGGRGGTYDGGAGASGGSGGGGAGTYGSGGSGTSGQGNNGGSTTSWGAGGGGGAGGAGSNGVSNVGGNGGIGIAYSISGTSTYYGGGGGGGGMSGIGTGGLGGGGNGSLRADNVKGQDGTANTGGGGGGPGFDDGGGTGGSGIVIIRYPTDAIKPYYEAANITQGAYALKVISNTASLNSTLTKTLIAPLNLSSKTYVAFDIRASRTGSNIKIGLHDSGGTTTEITPNITVANTYQAVSLDISGVSSVNRDAIDKIIITIVNADASNTFYIDNMIATDPASTSWVSSDTTATPISLDTSVKYEGAGSVKTTTTVGTATTIDMMEYSSDANAQTAYPLSIATGGTVTTSGNYRIHTFTSTGTLTVPATGIPNCEILVVGGGGGGGSDCGGGGGAGGVVYNSSFAVTSGSYTATVGNGGGSNTNGSNSTFSSLTAYGGGKGGIYLNGAGSSGGSGGGGNGTGAVGSGTSGQGNNGGSGSGDYAGGGGGGAGAVGGSSPGSNYAGNGGIGAAYSISGTSTYYGGGGGGGGMNSAGIGGTGGGGNGTIRSAALPGYSGTANTGGGGGGSGRYDGGGTGGSGIIILRYLSTAIVAYSESSIKTQGSYALKGIASSGTSLNAVLYRTLSSTVDLSNKTNFTFDIRSSRTGANIKIGLHDSGGTMTVVTPNITSTDTYQSVSLDISGVANANKDAIDRIDITIVNADAANTFYIDNMQGIKKSSQNDTITLSKSAVDLSSHTAISFWVRSTLAGQTMRFQFGESTSSEQTYNITINNANTWEQKIWDISGISSSAKNAVTKFAFVVTDASSSQSFYFDAIYANLGTSTPTFPLTEDKTNPTNVNSLTPYFSAVHNDPDSDAATYYRIQVNTAEDLSGTSLWDSGQTALTAVPSGSRSTNITYAGSTLSYKVPYYWRIMFWDQQGASTPWTAVQSFTVKPDLVAPTNCQANYLGNKFNVTWQDNMPSEDNYEIQRKIDNNGWISLSTLASSSVSYIDTPISSGHIYRYRVAALYTGPQYSGWCETTDYNIGVSILHFDGVNLDGVNLD